MSKISKNYKNINNISKTTKMSKTHSFFHKNTQNIKNVKNIKISFTFLLKTRKIATTSYKNNRISLDFIEQTKTYKNNNQMS